MPTRTFSFSCNIGDPIAKSVDVTAEQETSMDVTIPGGSGNQVIALAVDVSQLKGFYMVSDTDLVVKTNDPSTGPNTFTLAKGIPFVWTVNNAALRDTAGTAVTTDITSLNAPKAGADILLQVRVMVDPTL